MRWRWPTLLAVLLAACATPQHEQRYTGTLDSCGLTSATLTRAGNAASFAPGDGALILHGTIAADGGIAMSLNTQPPGNTPFVLTMQGRLAGETVTLTYSTPRCTANGTLRLVRPGIF